MIIFLRVKTLIFKIRASKLGSKKKFFNLKNIIHSNSLLRANIFDCSSISVTHLLNFKFFNVRRISSERLNNLDIYKKAYEEIVFKSNYGNKYFTNDKLKILDMTSTIKKVKLEGLMESINKWSYKCQPVKKVYIKKTNGKLRPQGIPSLEDKIIQTVIKLLIEQECENMFSVCNETSWSVCQALDSIRRMAGISWIIEGDIKNFIADIDYEILTKIIKNKFNPDRTIMGVLYKIFKAGYLLNNKSRHSILGIFQGGTLTAMLYSLYLTPLDDFMQKLKDKLEKDRKVLPKVKDKIYYVRYADGWVVGVRGSKEFAENIKEEIRIYLIKELKLELSQDKPITHIGGTKVTQRYAKFLGYYIVNKVNSDSKPKILVAINLIKSILMEKGFVDNKGTPKYLSKFIFLSDFEIVQRYNYVLKGILIIYSIADNSSRLRELIYILEYSLAHTLAAKHRKSLAKIFKKYGRPIKVILNANGLIKKIEFEKPNNLKAKYIKNKYATSLGSSNTIFNYPYIYDPFLKA